MIEAPPAAILIDLPAAPPQPTLDLPAPDMPTPVEIDVAKIDLPPPEAPPPVEIEVTRIDLPAPDMPEPVAIAVPEVALAVPEMPAPVTIAVAQVELPPPELPPPPDLAAMIERPRLVPPPIAKPRPPRPAPERAEVRQPPPSAQPSPPSASSPSAQPTAPLPAPALNATAMPTWQSAVLAQLQRHKRYPREARLEHQEGSATVRFTVDGEGRVEQVALLASSGHPALDQETLALLQRASPLPPPPPEAGRPPLTLTVPVQFNLKSASR